MEVDGSWVYIEADKEILLDRLGEVELPEITNEIPDEALVRTFELFQRGRNAISE